VAFGNEASRAETPFTSYAGPFVVDDRLVLSAGEAWRIVRLEEDDATGRERLIVKPF
jgi:hypothetical protein